MVAAKLITNNKCLRNMSINTIIGGCRLINEMYLPAGLVHARAYVTNPFRFGWENPITMCVKNRLFWILL